MMQNAAVCSAMEQYIVHPAGTFRALHSLCMPWIPRPLGENLCYHVRCQCNNRAFRFVDDTDFERYTHLLFATRDKLKFLLHDFALMHTHVHLILTTPGPILLHQIMREINQRYAVDYHRRHSRRGHFWMNGYRASVIDTDAYALTCMRYLHRNAPRAGMVSDPGEWTWSAYSFYAFGHSAYRIDPHPSYLAISTDPLQCQQWYREFVLSLLPSDEAREKEIITHALRTYGANTSRQKRKSSSHK
ncbi:MAG: transposase [Deltaproteobacteria bacterium]|nr:transposase [Deltaproteobacteria bacterium]